MSDILKTTLVVQPWIDKHSLRHRTVIHVLIANVSDVDPVLSKNTIKTCEGTWVAARATFRS